MSFSERNSKAASDYATKRKSQLEKASALRREREDSHISQSIRENDKYSLPQRSAPSFDDSSASGTAIVSRSSKNNVALDGIPGASVDIKSYEDQSGKIVAERIIIRPSLDSVDVSWSHEPSTGSSSASKGAIRGPGSRRKLPLGSSVSLSASLCPFLRPPEDPAGLRHDLSDRPLMCSSSDFIHEVIFGGTDHCVYSVDIMDARKRPVRMTAKSSGHTDWVTSVCHLPPSSDGRLVSGGMDGRLILWEKDRRRSQPLVGGHSKSISKVVSHNEQSVLISAGYEGNLAVWSLSGRAPPRILSSGQRDPILELVLDHSSLTCYSGNRVGGIHSWDVESGHMLSSIRAHPSLLSALHLPRSPGLLVSGGVDGYVKVWDTRVDEGSGLVNKSFNHHREQSGLSVSCLASIADADGSLRSIISGGADGSVVVLDARQSFRVLHRFEQGLNVQIIALASNDCLFAGDGSGKILCYDLSRGDVKYGLGASEVGAVNILHCFPHKLVSGAEDGKVLIFDY